MPKVIRANEFDRLIATIARHPEGIGIEALLTLPGISYPRRTLQRRLARLLRAHRIAAVGAGRALRYRGLTYPLPAPATAHFTAEPGADEAPVPLSAEGAEVAAYVRRPRLGRRPVAYQIGFLEAYQPNHSAYLPETLRRQLHLMGRSSAQDAPAGTFAKDIFNRLLIDLSWASSRLEGNTYSRLDTERLISSGQAAEGKDAIETRMILNHKAAIEYLVHDAAARQVEPATLIALHALLSDGLMADPQACGRLRQRTVEISGSVYLPLAVPQKVEELFGITVAMAAEIADPFEQAFFLMVHLPYLQPFEDVNKRVSRLAANIPLIRHNLAPLSFLDVPVSTYVEGLLGVYEMTRVELLRDVFVKAYERSCQQYVAVRAQMVVPDTFRMAHRNALAQVVRDTVQGGHAADAGTAARLMPTDVPIENRARFVALVVEEFKSIHRGNAIRFGVSTREFDAWLQAAGGS